MASNIQEDNLDQGDDQSNIISTDDEEEKEDSFRAFRALSSARRLIAWVTVGKFGPG